VSALTGRIYAPPVRTKLAAALLAAAGVTAAGSAVAAAPPSGICTTLVRGPQVTLTWTGRKTTSRLYYVSVNEFGCATAIRSMRRFIGRRSPGLQTRVSGAPRGFACLSLAPKGYTLFQGACKSKRRPRIGFVWTLAFG
jgi:hypothetical protein